MIRDLAALCYLEYRQIVNWMSTIVRQPGRTILYIIVIAYFVFSALMRARTNVAMPLPKTPEPYASILMFAYATFLGIVCYGAASGIVGAFSSIADARFLTGSLLSERTVVVWLQLRRSGAAIVRMVFTLVLYALIFSASGTFGGIGLAIIGGTILTTATAIPMLKLRAVAGARTAQSLAAVIIVAGLLPMTILLCSLVSPSWHRAATLLERTGGGDAFNALFNGNASALIALYAIAFALLALSFALGTGLYPELYASSLRLIAFREKQIRGGGAAFVMEHRYERRSASRLPFDRLAGPWTIAWKEWVAFMRSPSMQRIFLFGAAACGVCGGVFGTLVARSEHPYEMTISLATTAASMVVVFVAMGSAIGLGNDLRKPLWWVGPDPLWMRLVAWIAGTSWRLTVCLGIGLTAWSIAMHQPAVALAGVPIAAATVSYLRAVGLVLYAMFPSSVDQRGPLAMVRALLTYAFAAPPLIAGSLLGGLVHSIEAGLAVGILASIAETLVLVAFASSRIAGRGVAFAQAEIQ
jgi:Putative ABC exporter